MHLRCPHCHNPVEIVGDETLTDVACPSCGSHFSLISDDTTATYQPGGVKRLAHFELLEQVGMGQFGSVWKARDTTLQRTVALKIPRRGQLTADETEFFFRDARAAAQLKHPNIVSVHEVGREGDTVFIASDFIDGANLKEWLTARKLTPREGAELMIKIAEAVQHAHDRGVVHRDLKPGNIVIDQDGNPHVTDFGLAKRESGEITMTVDGQILGTPAYMSPEQARGKAHEADARSDVYALGVILFELLTSEVPFRGEKRMLIVQILNDEPPSPRKLNARVAKDLETIALKCLDKDPKRRYQTANDLGAELRRYLAGEPILARPITRSERLVRWSKRQPVVAGLTASLAAVLVIGTLVTGWFAVDAYRQADNATRAKDETSRTNIALQASEMKAIVAADRERGLRRRAEYDAARAAFEQACDQSQQGNIAEPLVRMASLISTLERPAEQRLAGLLPEATDLAHALRIQLQAIAVEANCPRLAVTHRSPVIGLAFSPDGTKFATASQDHTARVWDATTGKPIG